MLGRRADQIGRVVLMYEGAILAYRSSIKPQDRPVDLPLISEVIWTLRDHRLPGRLAIPLSIVGYLALHFRFGGEHGYGQ